MYISFCTIYLVQSSMDGAFLQCVYRGDFCFRCLFRLGRLPVLGLSKPITLFLRFKAFFLISRSEGRFLSCFIVVFLLCVFDFFKFIRWIFLCVFVKSFYNLAVDFSLITAHIAVM